MSVVAIKDDFLSTRKLEVYTTYSLAVSAATGTQLKEFLVTADPDSTKNGSYHYDGVPGVITTPSFSFDINYFTGDGLTTPITIKGNSPVFTAKKDRYQTINTISTATYRCMSTDDGTVMLFTFNGPITVSIPVSTSISYSSGTILEFVNLSTSTLTLIGDTNVTLLGTNNPLSQNSVIRAKQILTDTWLLS